MWGWFSDQSVWFLIGAGVIVVLNLILSEKIQKLIAKIEPDKWQQKAFGNISRIFWTFEAIAIAVGMLALVALTLSSEGPGTILTPEKVQEWFTANGINNIIVIIAGIVIWNILKKTIPPLVRRTMTRPQRGESREGAKRRANTLESVFLGLSRILIVTMAVLMILAEYVSIGPLLAGLGVVGIAVGFGAQFLIRDLIAGVFILMENQYRVGDVAKVADVIGSVEEINLRKTVLRDLDGIVHHVPNGEIRVASNYSRHYARVNLDISVSYGTDLNYAIGIINGVCSKMAEEADWKSVFRTVPEVLRVNKLGDSGIDIKVLGEVKPLEQWRVMGELRLRIKNEFDKVGIEIPWPHTKVFFGNKPGD
ncbi:MAG: mechanosensitive ion channel family protein [Dehalococcoidales bacterium]|nr:mechanosensitive ion channel family protein [Dehalococcoidales bacterium]